MFNWVVIFQTSHRLPVLNTKSICVSASVDIYSFAYLRDIEFNGCLYNLNEFSEPTTTVNQYYSSKKKKKKKYNSCLSPYMFQNTLR